MNSEFGFKLGLIPLLLTLAFFAACTDYVHQLEEERDEWRLVQAAEKSKVSSSKKQNVGEMVDSRDGRTYKTVTIGNQVWLAENLALETADSYCFADNDMNCETYGRLYTWDEAFFACPSRWHLPTLEEWNVLFSAVGGEAFVGEHLKSANGWNDEGNGMDYYGFSALPAGARDFNGSFGNLGDNGYFWSASEESGENAFYIDFFYAEKSIETKFSNKAYSFSVRCLMD